MCLSSVSPDSCPAPVHSCCTYTAVITGSRLYRVCYSCNRIVGTVFGIMRAATHLHACTLGAKLQIGPFGGMGHGGMARAGTRCTASHDLITQGAPAQRSALRGRHSRNPSKRSAENDEMHSPRLTPSGLKQRQLRAIQRSGSASIGTRKTLVARFQRGFFSAGGFFLLSFFSALAGFSDCHIL